MNIEIEAKFLHINHDAIRKKLLGLNASCVTPMRLMRRVIIDYPDKRLQTSKLNSYVRIRDEGDKVTLTFKQFDSLSIDGARECEVGVTSFDDTIKIFTSIGLHVVSYQESKRETWEVNACEVVLDEWPWLDPYIEIEATSELDIQALSSKLELDWSDAVFGDVMVAYREQYPYLTKTQTVGNIPEVLFGAPFPDLLKQGMEGRRC